MRGYLSTGPFGDLSASSLEFYYSIVMEIEWACDDERFRLAYELVAFNAIKSLLLMSRGGAYLCASLGCMALVRAVLFVASLFMALFFFYSVL